MRTLLLALLFAGCTTQDHTGYAKFQAAITTNEICGESSYAVLTIEGSDYEIPVRNIEIGVASEKLIALPMGWNEVTKVEVYNRNGDVISKVGSEIGGLNVVAVPFKIKIDNTVNEMSLQLECSKTN